jgi:hypothetical protein
LKSDDQTGQRLQEAAHGIMRMTGGCRHGLREGEKGPVVHGRRVQCKERLDGHG